MTQEQRLYNSVAPLRNVSALVQLIEYVKNRQHGLPGMATFYGPSGFGKSTAVVYAANKFGAYYLELKSCWTKKKLCQALLFEMGIEPQKTISDMVDQIAQELMQSDRVLLIDEADYLVSKNMIEIMRDIYESSATPVILVGEERLPTKLQKWERVHGRMLDWVAAKPACLEDVTYLAKIYCAQVDLDTEFCSHLLKASRNSIRRVCVNLTRVNEFAKTNGLELVNMKAWKGQFFACDAPAARRTLG